MINEGTQIGPYRVVRLFGKGGMGAVFEAVHQAIGRRVAIKVLHPEYAADAEFTERFFNEARAVNIVDHPGLVQISDYGRLPDGTAYIVMEYLKGETLGQRLLRGSYGVPVAEVVHLSWQVADSLVAAHEKGVVHRDLKPDNIMIVADRQMPSGERCKLLDFGIAKLTGASGDGSAPTQAGALLGTPAYMSPEQCAGAGGVDAKSDVYSLGCVIYQMLAGHPPFRGEGTGAVMGMHQFIEPPPLARAAPATPAPLAVLVHRLLAKQPGERPPMLEVAADLEALCAQYPVQSRRAPAGGGSSGRLRAGADINAATVAPGDASLPSERSSLSQAASEAQSAADAGSRWRLGLGVGVGLLATAGLAAVLWPARQRPAEPVSFRHAVSASSPALAVPAPAPPDLAPAAAPSPHQPMPSPPSLPARPAQLTPQPSAPETVNKADASSNPKRLGKHKEPHAAPKLRPPIED